MHHEWRKYVLLARRCESVVFGSKSYFLSDTYTHGHYLSAQIGGKPQPTADPDTRGAHYKGLQAGVDCAWQITNPVRRVPPWRWSP